MERVQCKEAGHNRTPPNSAGPLLQNKKQQQRVGCMEQKIDKVMAERPQAKELDIQHMREPGQWMPIAGVASLESPKEIVPGQSAVHMRIHRDVAVVVQVGEAGVKDRPINEKRAGTKEHAHGEEPETTTNLH